MKFKKENGKFYVNGEEFKDFGLAWAKVKEIFEGGKGEC